MFYTYIIRSLKDKKLYIGYTNNLSRRLKEHNSLKNKSTKGRAPFKVVYYEAYSDQEEAERREQNLKLRARALRQLLLRIKKSIND